MLILQGWALVMEIVDSTASCVVESANRMQFISRDLAVCFLEASVLVMKRVQMTIRT